MTEPLHWFSIRGAYDAEWRFLLSTSEISPELRSKDNPIVDVEPSECGAHGLHGITVYATETVYINALYSNDDIWRAALHELGHVALSPWTDAIAKDHGADAEESIVLHLEEGFSSMLPQLGLSMPLLPRGLEAMRRKGRRRK